MERRQLSFAVVAAEQLHIVTAAEGDERLAAALFTLGQLPLNARGLPAAQYHADTLQILGSPDSSAIGMGRLLTALQTLLWRYPQHAAAVRDLFNQWRVGALISNSPASQPRRRCTTGRWRRMNRGTALATGCTPAIRCG